MNIYLIAINAKYIHSNLAVYSLKAYSDSDSVRLAEYTINQLQDEILMDIYKKKPDVLCFSCYIWNIDYVEALIHEIAKLRPDLPIWVGGPEVSYDAKEVLTRLPEVKGVMKGEGEETFKELVSIYERTYKDERNLDSSDSERIHFIEEKLSRLAGITYRQEVNTESREYRSTNQPLISTNATTSIIRENPWRPVMLLSSVPFVYDDMDAFEHKIIYYETSRGCPFSCSYCLSSVDKKLRFRDVELAKKELQHFIDARVPQVKFVDRTFNCSHKHAMEIWTYLKEHDEGYTNFHFEVAADLLNEEEIALLETVRPGLFQLEIGVQSTNPKTIKEIRRVMDFDRVSEVVKRIQNAGNVHQHLDLIAGLPFEDIESFARSFDDVYGLKPEQLQLGFLKVLKGSYMEEKKEDYGIVYKNHPPYEVLYTKWISYDDIMRLKGIEEMVEVYYNSRQFTHTIEELETCYESAFEMFDALRMYYEDLHYHEVKHRRSARYEILLNFVKMYQPQKTEVIRDLLTFDYYLRENAKTRPEFAGEYDVDKSFLRGFYEQEEKERVYLPSYEKFDKNQMRKMTHIEYFKTKGVYILFDYLEKNPLNQEARFVELKP